MTFFRYPFFQNNHQNKVKTRIQPKYKGNKIRMESFKKTSRIITVLASVGTMITAIGVDQLASYIPSEYSYLIAIIIIAVFTCINQYSEETRVITAEALKEEELKTVDEDVA